MPLRVCVNSQTPFIRFNLSYSELVEKYGVLDDPVDLKMLEQGVDYDFSPGGVTAMVYPLIRNLLNEGYFSSAYWVSLGVDYPPNIRVDNILLSHVELEDKYRRDYASFKERLWAEIHGFGEHDFLLPGYSAYVHYNSVNAQKLLEYVGKVDLFEVEDFQQLLVGQLIGPSAPAILRWHVPFVPEHFDGVHQRFILKAVEGFDAVVVSTRRDLEGLIRISYHGRAHQIYPFVDPGEWSQPDRASKQEFSDAVGLREDERLLVVVARMDRIKSQDVAIKALARLAKREKLRLVLIGNGSFTSSGKGGLAHGKASGWRAKLEELAKSLGVSDRVVFLGYSPKRLIEAAYSCADLVLLPSKIEGFGVTVLEAWLYKKPVVVSSGAGVSELVVDGSNGYVFPSGNDEKLAERILEALGPNTERLGENGYETSKRCHLKVCAENMKTVYEQVFSLYAQVRK
ncbi:MAG: glycosyltransferase family 4 protein [Thermoprotei archaeon]